MSSFVSRITAISLLIGMTLPGSVVKVAAQQDPLPSWNDGPTKKAITDFVGRVTTEGTSGFIPVPERIATFDNDGTLWTEQPYYFQIVFALDEIKRMAPQRPEWKQEEPFNSIAQGDLKGLAKTGRKVSERCLLSPIPE